MEALRPSNSASTEWMRKLLSPDGDRENKCHFWGDEPSSLSIGSTVENFTTGIGEDIFMNAIIPVILSATQEIILVTCFWAPSPSLTRLSAALVELSSRQLAQGLPKIRVWICFSSRSLFQKLFHTSNRKGQEYPPSTWASKLGLPTPDRLQGLDLRVKSLFFLPFSVLHPKFVIVDRSVALLPSCNVSWETWLECCVKVSGPIVIKLLDFWAETWETDGHSLDPSKSLVAHKGISSSALIRSSLLPSPHHRNPHFRPLFLRAAVPLTPLNIYLLHSFGTAKTSINITTPNLTCASVISALLDALARGVNVEVSTCRRMMMAEQLVTAGTITEFCVRSLVRRHKQLSEGIKSKKADASQTNGAFVSDLEPGRPNIGKLRVIYFTPKAERPEVKCHIKCTVIDGSVIILGSGNMDRASWYTSQELGFALEDRETVKRLMQHVDQAKQGLFEDCYYAS